MLTLKKIKEKFKNRRSPPREEGEEGNVEVEQKQLLDETFISVFLLNASIIGIPTALFIIPSIISKKNSDKRNELRKFVQSGGMVDEKTKLLLAKTLIKDKNAQ